MTPYARAVRALFIAAALAPAAFSAAAYAADNTRYISIAGSNANPCTLAQPCKTLQRGVAMTPAGGELRILNSGFYGNNATIRKSLTITGNGNTVFLGAALTVNAPGAVVAVRDLTINGQGTIHSGIHIAAASTVHIERCVFHRFQSHGISVFSMDADVFVIGTTARDNGASGLFTQPGTQVRISNSTFTANLIGINNVQGTIETRGNNTVRGNTTNVLGDALTLFVGL